ncbi:S1/P1 nuclease [Novosphingobium tardum]|uniref:S1/P1 nuclease n=1 Tax=Novosphingobium tardum TaxID=1538021 RepID=A0ABV8RL91_9SPHN
MGRRRRGGRLDDRPLRGSPAILRRTVARVVACLIFAATVQPALAWSDYSHRAIATIAQDNVRPHTRAEIARLLRAAPQLGTPDCPVKSIEDAATWPDCVRRDRERWAYTTPWHYDDQDICKPFKPQVTCANGTCVSAQVERNRKLLADRALPAPLRMEALAFLVHFVGDLHQPLHEADRDDAGANALKADYGIAPVGNLHTIWDRYLAERAVSSASPPLTRRYSAVERAAWGSGEVVDWSRESYELSRDLSYRGALKGDPCDGAAPHPVVLDEAAIEAALPAVRDRIARGGLRLARLLDEALD